MSAASALRRTGRVIVLVAYYVRNLVAGNLQVAREVMTPEHRIQPAIVRFPLRIRSDLGVVVMANMISFTPGTLTVDVADDLSALYVHGMHVSSADDLRGHLRALEDRLLGVLQ
ncbi:MAG TPA: Na+/H+ antiporter subunit E [Nitriliruptorales bacterium]|nr:Na+/H+ antiporter subunit E [Nitriliruptorales bacterium]